MINKTRPAHRTGKLAEGIAADFLKKQGIKILDKNFHSRFGEIDLIALDGEYLVFIEVRYRKNEFHMAVVETIDHHKCKKIISTSAWYLTQHRKYQAHVCRYDVIGITGVIEQPAIEWIKNAFQA